jgi:hypothetical protein
MSPPSPKLSAKGKEIVICFPDSCDTPFYGATKVAGKDPSILARPAVPLRDAGN